MANTLPADGFVRLPQIIGDRRKGVVGVLPISRSAWWQGIKDGKYPRPVKLGPRTTAWRSADVAKLIASLSA